MEAYHLKSAIGMLRAYVSNQNNQAPLLVASKPGWGRGHWIDTVLKECGFEPRWLRDLSLVPEYDIEGTRLFPVYELAKVEFPPVDRAIVLIDIDAKPPESMKGCMTVVFQAPGEAGIEAFVEAAGCPKELAQGNPDYWAATHAIRAWQAAKVPIRAIESPRRSWDEFRRGGPRPVDGMLFAYYLGENLGPKNWAWNRSLGMEKKLPREIFELLLDEIRLAMPKGEPKFPWVLTIKKSGQQPAIPERAPTTNSRSAVAGRMPELGLSDRSYAVDW